MPADERTKSQLKDERQHAVSGVKASGGSQLILYCARDSIARSLSAERLLKLDQIKQHLIDYQQASQPDRQAGG